MSDGEQPTSVDFSHLWLCEVRFDPLWHVGGYEQLSSRGISRLSAVHCQRATEGKQGSSCARKQVMRLGESRAIGAAVCV